MLCFISNSLHLYEYFNSKEASALRIVILSVVLILSTLTVSNASTTIRITNGEWEPYLSEYSYEFGLVSHIITEAFKQEGISIEWGFFPWKRSLEVARSGLWDASAAWMPTKKREEDFWISEPVINTSFVFFYLKEKKFHWESYIDLKGLHIGLTRGYSYGQAFTDAIDEHDLIVDITTKDEQNFQRLLHGRMDIFPNNPVVGYAQLRKSFTPEQQERITHHPKALVTNSLNLLISKKCKNGRLFFEKFNAGLKKLKNNGRIIQMFKYLNSGKYDKQLDKWNY